MGRYEAVEREARKVADALLAGRRAEFVSVDATYRRDVLTRLHQLLAGDETPPFGDPNGD